MNKMDRVVFAINEADAYMRHHHDHMLDSDECIAVVRVLEVIIELAIAWSNPWREDTPTKAGVYRVKSSGPSPNPGWRYWHGPERGWGNLHGGRNWCLQASKRNERKSQLKYAVLWLDPILAKNQADLKKLQS